MSKKRVHEIGKQLKEQGIELSNQELVEKLHALGYDVKSHSSSLEDDQAASAYEKIVGERKPKPAPCVRAGPGFVVRKRVHVEPPPEPVLRGAAAASPSRTTRRSRSPRRPTPRRPAPRRPLPPSLPPSTRRPSRSRRRPRPRPSRPREPARRAVRPARIRLRRQLPRRRRLRRAPWRRRPRRTAPPRPARVRPRPADAQPVARVSPRSAACARRPAVGADGRSAAPAQPGKPPADPRTLRPTSTQAVVISRPLVPVRRVTPPSSARQQFPAAPGPARARRGPRVQGRPGLARPRARVHRRLEGQARAAAGPRQAGVRGGREEPLGQGAAPGGDHRLARTSRSAARRSRPRRRGRRRRSPRRPSTRRSSGSRSRSRSRSSPRRWASRRPTSSAS